MQTGLNINSKQTAGLPRLFLAMFVLTPHITRGSESVSQMAPGCRQPAATPMQGEAVVSGKVAKTGTNLSIGCASWHMWFLSKIFGFAMILIFLAIYISTITLQ